MDFRSHVVSTLSPLTLSVELDRVVTDFAEQGYQVNIDYEPIDCKAGTRYTALVLASK